MLTTLLPPTSGWTWIDGYDLIHHAADERRVIGYVPRMLSVDGTLTGYENLLIFAKLYDIPCNEREERVRDGLEFMGLSDAAFLRQQRYPPDQHQARLAEGNFLPTQPENEQSRAPDQCLSNEYVKE
jgi:ABC-type multidrug transport system ATPase subunit